MCVCVFVCVCTYVLFNNIVDALNFITYGSEIQDVFSDEMLRDDGAHGANRSNFPASLLVLINK